ncbi:MAG: TolC family protein, partial [Myxococcales bacterium]|nr:TolC family protein [Myxococcales bacterium]
MIRPVWRNARAAVVAGLMAVVWVVSAQEARAQATPGVEPSGPSTPVAEPASGTTQGPDAAGTLPGPESSTAGTAAPGGGASGARTEAVDLGSRPAALSFEFVPLVSQAGGGLTADGAAARVVQVSPTTRVAAAEAQVAERRAGRAYSVFMPRVDLTASYTRLSQATPRVPPELREPFLPVLDQYALRATMRVPVSDYFLTLHEQYDRAQRLAGVAELQRLGQWQAMAYQARSDYYELAGAIAGRNLARHRVDQLEKFVEEIRVLVEGGEVSRVQLEQARSRLSLARSEASAAVVRLRVA